MANLIGDGTRAIMGMFAAGRDAKAARREAERQQDLIKSLDWTPTTTAELAPTYQRSQSPVARSYLESFLLGNNPDAVMPGDPMAAQKKRQMQHSQNTMFGTPAERVAQQNAYRATTPWAVDPDKVAAVRNKGKAKKEEIAWAQNNKQHSDMGLTKADLDAMETAGVEMSSIGQKKRSDGKLTTEMFANKTARANKDVVQYMARIGAYDDLQHATALIGGEKERQKIFDHYRRLMEKDEG